MPQNLARKILASHLISGEMNVGEEIAVRVDQTLTHDVTGTQAYLAFETMNIPKVKTELSVSYVDHNLLYADNKNPDDHIYLQTIAKKYGLYLSRAGNGICHLFISKDSTVQAWFPLVLTAIPLQAVPLVH